MFVYILDIFYLRDTGITQKTENPIFDTCLSNTIYNMNNKSVQSPQQLLVFDNNLQHTQQHFYFLTD